MQVDGYCFKCKNEFDAHWHIMKTLVCPFCGNTDRSKIKIDTDESGDYDE